MRKRVYLDMALLAALSVLLVSVALSLVYYGQYADSVRADVRHQAQLVAGEPGGVSPDALAQLPPTGLRLTLIAADGAVLFDSTVPASALENHADRAEFLKALADGSGESTRYSGTLREETYYYALRLPDGQVLRAAKTVGSTVGVFVQALPWVALVVLVVALAAYLVAGRLTRRIVRPINALDLDGEPVPPYDELAPFVRAIRRQRQQIAEQEADLQERADTMSAIMADMNEGAVLIDAEGVVLSVNQSALDIFNAAASVTGESILDLMRDVDLIEYTRAALRGQRGETGMSRNDRDYQVYFSPAPGSGALLLFLDTTEKVKAEKLRREFSANVSHELKTPLTSISGYAELLASGMTHEDDRAEFTNRIKNESARMIALVEDIMLLSRLDEGRTDETAAEVDLAQVAAEAADSLALKASELGIQVTVSGGGVLPNAHRSLMQELFYNLIDNAIKYNHPGGSVSVVLFLDEDGRLVAQVTDTGIGIPPAEQPRVFERFHRVDRSRSKSTGGTGLGLAIVKHIARIHNAELALTSTEGEGTIVRVVFPAISPCQGFD
jgi:two-component system phosphate regulon sensor histidine kinase PhoR